MDIPKDNIAVAEIAVNNFSFLFIKISFLINFYYIFFFYIFSKLMMLREGLPLPSCLRGEKVGEATKYFRRLHPQKEADIIENSR